MKTIQLLLLAACVLMSLVTFIGIFFNPIHIVTFGGSLMLSHAIYKEKRW